MGRESPNSPLERVLGLGLQTPSGLSVPDSSRVAGVDGDFRNGFFLRPTVLRTSTTLATRSAGCVRPVLSVIPFTSEDEVSQGQLSPMVSLS